MDDVQRYTKDLKSEEWWTRMDAAGALGVIGKDLLRSGASRQSQDYRKFCNTAVPALVEALGDEAESVRYWAIDALGKIGKPAVPALVKALGDKNEHVREGATGALGKIGDASAVPTLVKALGDEYGSVIGTAAWALGEIVNKCETIEALGLYEKGLKEGCAFLRKKHPDKNELIEIKMDFAKLMKKVSEKKNELASKRDVLLDDKPKPPERGKMYQVGRRVRNG